MKLKSFKQTMLDTIPLVERTHLPYLPISRKILDVPLTEKYKFWKGLFFILLLSVPLLFLPIVPFGLIIALAINCWWFIKWNRYLNTVQL